MPTPTREQIEEREALAAQGLKRCSPGVGCGEALPHGDFARKKDSWDGLRGTCRGCDRVRAAGFRENSRDKRAAYMREWYATNRVEVLECKRIYHLENPWVFSLRDGYNRAVEAGNEAVWLSQDQLLEHWAKNDIDPWKCFYTGTELVPGVNRSLDHRVSIANGGSHMLDNLVPCDWDVNIQKRNQDAEEFLTGLEDAA